MASEPNQNVKVSVVIPYRNRPDNLKILLRNLQYVKKERLDFHLVSLGDVSDYLEEKCDKAGVHFHHMDYQGLFAIGKALNYGASKARGEFILKQDVDCLPYVGIYTKIVDFAESITSNKLAWANLGVYYCNAYFTQKYLQKEITYEIYAKAKYNDCYKEKLKVACGNCYLVNREHYLNIGGVSDRFVGWGWEDYQLLYYLEKSFNPSFALSSYDERSIVKKCREELSRPKNIITNELDLVFLHRWHDPNRDEKNYRLNTQNNKKILLNLVSNFRSGGQSDSGR